MKILDYDNPLFSQMCVLLTMKQLTRIFCGGCFFLCGKWSVACLFSQVRYVYTVQDKKRENPSCDADIDESGGKRKKRKEKRKRRKQPPLILIPPFSLFLYTCLIFPLFPRLFSQQNVYHPSRKSILSTTKSQRHTLREMTFLLFLGKHCGKLQNFFIFFSSLFASESQMLLRRNNRTPFGSPSLIHYRKRERGKKGRHHLSAPLRTFGGLVFWAGERKRMSSRRMRRRRRLFPSLVRIRLARAEEEEEEEGRETCQ